MSETITTDGLWGQLMTAPPVYAPGGPVALVKDPPETLSVTMLDAFERGARERGAVLVVAPCPEGDLRASVLSGAGYAVASSWFKGPTRPGSGEGDGIRAATAQDVPRLLEIGEAARRRKERYAPVFWKRAPTPREAFAPYVTQQVENPAHVALVAERAGRVVGYGIAQKDYVDDFTVEDLGDWPTVGVALLRALGERANRNGVESFVIVAPQAETGKCDAIRSLGYAHTENWFTKPLG